MHFQTLLIVIIFLADIDLNCQVSESVLQQPEVEPSVLHHQLLKLINTERQKAEVPPLKLEKLLQQAAQSHSNNMAEKGELLHDLDNKGPNERLTDLNYHWSAVAENIAKGQSSPAQALTSWMNSELHRNNILNGTFQDVGIAQTKSRDGSVYWTVVFAKRK